MFKSHIFVYTHEGLNDSKQTGQLHLNSDAHDPNSEMDPSPEPKPMDNRVEIGKNTANVITEEQRELLLPQILVTLQLIC